MSGSYPVHSLVITNFIAMVRWQLKGSTCNVFGDNVRYVFKDDSGIQRNIIPDASINCSLFNVRGAAFLNAPRFVMEVLSPSTEKYDKGEKKKLYLEQEIDDYWIVDYFNKTVEIWSLDCSVEDPKPKYFFIDLISKENPNNLCIPNLPKLKVSYEDLFYGVDEALELMQKAVYQMKIAKSHYDACPYGCNDNGMI